MARLHHEDVRDVLLTVELAADTVLDGLQHLVLAGLPVHPAPGGHAQDTFAEADQVPAIALGPLLLLIAALLLLRL
ncbi:hypothetical protein [Deinococcus humi]|uniref:Uncharacterized protein n=1 Tax=Deinococcus humi TaxID=662880 RepID=A0A7W8ND85_9DEIO|nr:hypothetical protein [Deinococcus humi]MBB5362086.1 hypothetical protein [Deinococcus humi]GGO22127.1 hypothetical protein GCM10008949_09090 [Deinococcus humi]